MREFGERYDSLFGQDVVLVAISSDSLETHRRPLLLLVVGLLVWKPWNVEPPRLNDEPWKIARFVTLPEFKKPIQHQTPRQVRLGLRYSF